MSSGTTCSIGPSHLGSSVTEQSRLAWPDLASDTVNVSLSSAPVAEISLAPELNASSSRESVVISVSLIDHIVSFAYLSPIKLGAFVAIRWKVSRRTNCVGRKVIDISYISCWIYTEVIRVVCFVADYLESKGRFPDPYTGVMKFTVSWRRPIVA